MTTEEELALSYYREIGQLNAEHGVALVQHSLTKRLYVRKILTVYNTEVYHCLMEHPVPNTPRVFEAVEDNDRLTVIEEYIDGTNLRDLVEQGSLPFEQALDIAEQLCRIVANLHGFIPPIIHRDIKPSNIILADDGTVKLLDMNAAKQVRYADEQDTQLIGTAGFAAPEQYGFGTSTAQTDIYAIGVLLATMVYGSFSRNSLGDSPYDRIVEKCTRMDPGDRYCTAYELLRDLNALRHTPSRIIGSSKYIRWLPPGFRSLKPLRMIVSLFLYVFLFFLGSTLPILNPISQADVILNRVFFILCCLATIFFLGNYMNIWEILGITKIRVKGLRHFVILLGAGLCFISLVIIMVIIESGMG